MTTKIEEIDQEDLRKYFASFPPTEVVGEMKNPFNCPIKHYLASKDPHVSAVGFGVYRDNTEEVTGIDRFTREILMAIDASYYRCHKISKYITAQEVLDILDNLVNGGE